MPTDNLTEYVASNNQQFFTPSFVEKVNNQNLHALEQADYLIITPPGFISHANRLADLHRSNNGLTVHVINVNEIYNEFSSGAMDAGAIRRNVFQRNANHSPRTFGEIIMQTKIGTSSSSTDKMAFTLIGDPALKIALPQYKIVIDSINGVNPQLATDTIQALSKVKVKAHIEDFQGNVLTNFNGVATPSLYDKPKQLKTLGQKPGPSSNHANVNDFELQKNIIYRGQSTVTNGHFSFEFIVPKDINYSYGNGKFSLYADNKNVDAAGEEQRIIVGGVNPQGLDDDIGPEINMFLNNENFVNGGITDEVPFLIAKLKDENGINTVGNGIGHDITIVIDEKTSNPIVLNEYFKNDLDSYQSGELRYQLTKLAPGRHTLTLKVWDVNNNSSQETIEFIVQEKSELSLDHVLNYPNPFTTNTEFYFEHNQCCTELEAQIQIFTVSGRLVKTINKSIYTQGYRSEGIHWDGKDDFGDDLARGVYVYRLKNTLFRITTIVLGLTTLDAAAQVGVSEKDMQKLSLNTITTALPFMSITPDSRAGGMGEAGTALSGSSTSLYWNTSMLIFAEEKSEISVSYTPWLRNLTNDMHLSYVSGYYKFGRHAVGGALRFFSLGEITYTDQNGGFIRNDKPNEFELTAGYAFKLSDRLSVGVNGKFAYSNLTGGYVVEGVDSKAAIAGAADVSFTYFNDQSKIGNINVDKDTFCIDTSKIEAAITSKTKAIVPVHLYGQAADMDAIMEIAQKHNLFVVEDNAQAIGCDYIHNDGSVSKTGTIGTIGCTSFFPSKNLGCYGDGGALFTNDDELASKIRMIANHGQSKRYYHDVVGCNSRLDSIQAAVLRIKLRRLDEYNSKRRAVADYYDRFFFRL
ncbi:DegT/DnrJ/EryC1/StrS aminotransferase family protein [Ancylostoma ceylanicum]|uniref:DegT/DnrJ/EryC1/StrS aminotransferase family protein n=1 Tax=Ancylostoma ceylanicum TaxID=53326 RepID=A0A0D6L5I4_9BILA|nr:DegT/DnrJ/EryC1/StrS aminotransferase family protein [Ancylostoma ceylanicum]